MLRFILTTCFSLILLTGMAQKKDKVISDTTEITIGNKVLSIISDSSKKGKDYHFGPKTDQQKWDVDEDEKPKKKKRKAMKVEFFNLDLGMNFLTSGSGFNLPTDSKQLETKPINSTHIGLHFLETRLLMAKGHFNVVTAITLDNNRYAFQDNISLIPGHDSLTVFQDSLVWQKNKLITWHLQVPLMLEFQSNPSNPHKNFHLAVGGYAGLLLSTSLKQKSKEFGKTKRNGDYNLDALRYGLMARIGYRSFDFYVNYDMNSMFREDQGPNIQPVRFGMSITGLFKG